MIANPTLQGGGGKTHTLTVGGQRFDFESGMPWADVAENYPESFQINGDKIALSMKFPEENPWLSAAEDFAVGNVVTGKVARMTDFGAFVELEPGVDALLHVSQIAKEHIEKPSDVLKVGQEVTAKVVDFKKDDRKISLSIKALDNE